MPKSRKRPKAEHKARRQRRVASEGLAGLEFRQAPWQAWRGVWNEILAGTLPAGELDVVEQIPFTIEQGRPVTLRRLAGAGMTVAEVVEVLEYLADRGWIVWSQSLDLVLLTIPEDADAAEADLARELTSR